jgi:tetratricopeptide (TPR) repeat protein
MGVLEVRLAVEPLDVAERGACRRRKRRPERECFAAELELNRMLASALRARIAAERGDAAEALATLEEMRFESTDEPFLPPSGSHGHQRHLRPDLLRLMGREKEALRWYGSLPWYSALRENTLLDLVHLAPFHLGQAELYEQLGERENAAEHHTRFIELWLDADPELQPRMREAEQSLARLRTAGREK